MKRVVIEETTNLTGVGEAIVYHYIDYSFFHCPTEVRFTRYRGGRLDGMTEKYVVIHSNERFSRNVKPKIPFKKRLINIPIMDKKEFDMLYAHIAETVIIDYNDPLLKSNNIPKKVIENIVDMKIAEHFYKLNEYYAIVRRNT